MLLNSGVGEGSWESFGLQGDPTSPSKGDQSWVFIGRTDVEVETPKKKKKNLKLQYFVQLIRSWLIGKDPDAWKD